MDRLARRLAGPIDGEDVLQNALAAAWRSRDRFVPERGSRRGWLLAIVANEARDHHSRNSRALPIADVVAFDGLEMRSENLDLTAALAALSHRQRVAVALFYYLHLSVAECAEVMGCADGTVKSTLSDARRRLRAALGKDYR